MSFKSKLERFTDWFEEIVDKSVESETFSGLVAAFTAVFTVYILACAFALASGFVIVVAVYWLIITFGLWILLTVPILLGWNLYRVVRRDK